eukprot:8043889-Alexandrium_andersonii.AAC.1
MRLPPGPSSPGTGRCTPRTPAAPRLGKGWPSTAPGRLDSTGIRWLGARGGHSVRMARRPAATRPAA